MSRDQPISPSQTPNDAGDEVAVKPQPSEPIVYRSNRPSRACTLRAAAKLQQATANNDRSHKPKKDNRHRQKQRRRRQEEAEEVGEDGGYESPPCEEKCSGSGSSKIVTSLVAPPEPAQLSRWNLRSMWELASVLNFLHVFRPFLNIPVEFSAEEFETALLTPNYTLGSIHMPLLKAIPPITRSALTQDTWITVLCKKLKDWWHWVADGDLPIVASHGLEIEEYKSLDPGVRVVILKALCDIRVEVLSFGNDVQQEDIRSYIDSSIKQGAQLSLFRKERIGGDSHGISYWYEPDELVGFRLYREIRKTEVPGKGKARGSKVLPSTVYQWETVATNYDEFLHVSEKLFASENRTEVSLGKKLKNDKLPEIEKVHKRKERLLKKQHREALLLDNYLSVDGLAAGRSLRDRKHVTYTFDDYDRSINEAIKVTKYELSPYILGRNHHPLSMFQEGKVCSDVKLLQMVERAALHTPLTMVLSVPCPLCHLIMMAMPVIMNLKTWIEAATGEDRGHNGIQKKTMLRLFQTMKPIVKMISKEKLFMTRNT
ncbi:DDT domain-containing protein DDR4 [Linum perenne]